MHPLDALDDGWLTAEDCAVLMRITVDQVHALVRRRVLRSTGTGPGLLVQPAVLSGAVDC